GATSFRTAAARRILETVSVSVVRGNASEILSLRNDNLSTRGVDTIHTVEDAAGTAKTLAKELRITFAITGPADLVTDGKRVLYVLNGHMLMVRVTGIGCAATAAIAAFCSVDKDLVTAAAAALAFFGLAGEIAGKKASAPGSFMIHLIDALYSITPEMLKNHAKIEDFSTP
ncbi:MAG: hydroxyethylthiazole kinase, partial [Deltaproteobacteria bacterium]|nr:hydroxyethylthiazole kinase [Deltaproteobacteria bacterium]